tara:strand:- start:3473 stop:3691 length:219 start_codon:yes stop_codon:yes gene_type:complete
VSLEPFSHEEICEATEEFFEAFDIVEHHMPTGSSMEDTLKVCEYVVKLASKRRKEREKQEREELFGFFKSEN